MLSSHNPLAETRLRPGKQRSNVVLVSVGSVSILGMFVQLCVEAGTGQKLPCGRGQQRSELKAACGGIRKWASVGLESGTKLR